LYRFELIDVVLAMGVAGLVNGAMLIMAAATFNRSGLVGVGSIEDAHLTLAPLLGHASSVVFALSLLASGLSSTMVGTMSGQLVMQGFLQKQVPLWLRRLVTFIPPFAIIGIGLDPTRTLVVSQVILSFALPFALVPLLYFSGQKKIMGALVNSRLAKGVGALVAGLIISLNLYLLWRTFTGG
ncbi:MAG: Nramp family divalent metal transporter, partial [Mycobacterium leprae]